MNSNLVGLLCGLAAAAIVIPAFKRARRRLDLFGIWIYTSAQIAVLLALFWIRDDVLRVPQPEKSAFVYPVAIGFGLAILFAVGMRVSARRD